MIQKVSPMPMADEITDERAVEANPPPEVTPPPEPVLTAPEPPAAPPPPDADERESFFVRLRAAFKGFSRGLRGLPVEIPPGEEGTIPVVEAEATRRRLEKKLEKSRSTADKLRDEVAGLKQVLLEHEAAAKQLDKELKRISSASAETEAGLRRELEPLRASLAERDATIEHIRAEMAQRHDEIKQAAAALVATQQQLEEMRILSASREEQFQKEIVQVRDELKSKEDALAGMRVEGASATQSTSEEIAGLKQSLATRELELQSTRNDLASRQEELRHVRDETVRQLEPLHNEVEKLIHASAETEATRATLSVELAEARTQLAALDEIRRKLAHTEKELGRAADDGKVLREDVHDKIRRIADLETKAKDLEETAGQRDSLSRELKQRMLQFEAMHSEFSRMQLRVEKLKKSFDEFHTGAVNAVQVASVYADFAVASKDLTDGDRENVTEMKQAIDQFRQSVLKLSAAINEPDTPPQQ